MKKEDVAPAAPPEMKLLSMILNAYRNRQLLEGDGVLLHHFHWSQRAVGIYLSMRNLMLDLENIYGYLQHDSLKE
jgi:hypothetical protein